MVRVTAPDRIGLLSAVCRWFADHDISVEAASISTVDGVAKDVFLVDGECDVDGLARHLSAERTHPLRLLDECTLPVPPLSAPSRPGHSRVSCGDEPRRLPP